MVDHHSRPALRQVAMQSARHSISKDRRVELFHIYATHALPIRNHTISGKKSAQNHGVAATLCTDDHFASTHSHMRSRTLNLPIRGKALFKTAAKIQQLTRNPTTSQQAHILIIILLSVPYIKNKTNNHQIYILDALETLIRHRFEFDSAKSFAILATSFERRTPCGNCATRCIINL